MRAVVLPEFGGPEVLRYEDVPTPKPGPGEVLMRVHSVSVNRTLDLVVREGKYPRKPNLPHVLGVDPAGVVEAVGPGVSGFQPGQRVVVYSGVRCGQCPQCLAGQDENCRRPYNIGVGRWGGYAEYASMPAEAVYPIPDSLSFAEATVIARHGPTAFNLTEKAELGSGEWALVMGAAGALGSVLVQVARAVGAKVIAAAGADERVAAACSYGAQYGVNYRQQDLAAEVMRITEGNGVDVLYENIADPTLWPGAFNSLAYNGRLVTAGAHGGGTVPLDVRRLYLNRLRIIGSPGAGRRHVQRALQAGGAGHVRAIIDRVMPLREAAAAHRLLESNAVLGKIILDPTLE